MRIVKILLVVIIIALAGYWFVWNKHANQSKDQLISRIEQLNTNAGITADDFHLGYDSIDLGGFPFSVALKIQNPSVRYNDKALLHWLAPTAQQAKAIEDEVNETQTDSAMIEDWKLDGTLSLSGNYMERSFSAVFDGTSTGTSTRQNETLNVKGTIDGDSTCKVVLNKDASFSILNEDLFSQFKDKELLLKTFQSIDCHSDKSELVNIDTEETLVSMDESNISFSAKSLANNEKDIRVTVKLKDAYQSKQWEQWIAGTTEILKSSLQSESYLFSDSAEGLSAGVQNINIDAHYKGTTDFSGINDGKIDLDLKIFEWQNDLFSISAASKIFMERKDSNETIRIKGSKSIEVAPEVSDHIKNYINYMVHYASDKKNNHPARVQFQTWARQNGGVNGLIDALQELVPNFEEIGKIELKTDIDYDIKNDPQGFDNKKDLNVKELSLKMKPYSVVAGGTMSLTDMKSDMSIRCHSCDMLMDDLFNFYNSTNRIYVMQDISDVKDVNRFTKLVQSFVHQITTQEDNGKTLLLTLKDDGKGGFLISGKPVFQVMMLWTQVFIPNMEKEFKANKDGSIIIPR